MGLKWTFCLAETAIDFLIHGVFPFKVKACNKQDLGSFVCVCGLFHGQVAYKSWNFEKWKRKKKKKKGKKVSTLVNKKIYIYLKMN